MAKLNKDELLTKLKAYTGDRTDDETLEIIEDVSDSIDGGDDEAAKAAEAWEAKYNDLAKKYKDRFTDGDDGGKDPEPKKTEEKKDEDPDDKAEKITIDDLFEEED